MAPLSGIFDLTKPIDDTPEGGFTRFIHPPFGTDPVALERASPARRLRAAKTPMLIVLAGNDYRDMQAQSRSFYEAARARMPRVRFEVVPGRGHFELVRAIGSPQDPTTALLERFVLRPD